MKENNWERFISSLVNGWITVDKNGKESIAEANFNGLKKDLSKRLEETLAKEKKALLDSFKDTLITNRKEFDISVDYGNLEKEQIYMDGFVACLNLIRKEIEQLSKEKEDEN